MLTVFLDLPFSRNGCFILHAVSYLQSVIIFSKRFMWKKAVTAEGWY